MEVTLSCLATLKKPAHVGFGTGKQVRDVRRQPLLPSLTLTTQISTLALRLAKAMGRPAPKVKVSDGFVVGKAKEVKVRGQEFFLGTVAFTVRVEEKELDLVLGALKLLQNLGIGANTSMGFGYCEVKVVKTSKGEAKKVVAKVNPKAEELAGEGDFSLPPTLVRFAQSLFNRLKSNWASWFRAVDPTPFQRLVYLMGETELSNPFAYRGWLRARLLERFPYEHRGGVTTCPPKGRPCQVCQLMGRMGGKSRVIVRVFSKKEGKNVVYVLVDNPTDEELAVLKEVGGLKVVKEEGLGDFVPL